MCRSADSCETVLSIVHKVSECWSHTALSTNRKDKRDLFIIIDNLVSEALVDSHPGRFFYRFFFFQRNIQSFSFSLFVFVFDRVKALQDDDSLLPVVPNYQTAVQSVP